MANKNQPFRQFHVTRGLRGAMAAGAPNPTVELHLPEGAKMVVSAGGNLDTAAVPKPKARPAAPSRPSRPAR
jgi:hypothetical protein